MATGKRVPARFYRNANGNEPVRAWLKALSRPEKRAIGVDIMTVEYGWPIGMPTCRPLGRAFMRCAQPSGTGSLACCSVSLGESWSCFMASSRRHDEPRAEDIALARTRMKEVQ